MAWAKNQLVFLGLILAAAALLRLWGLDRVPLELFGDELDVGYHAYSLWKTGRDYTGQFLPTYIHSFAEWRAPLLMYITAPFVGLVGLNGWGVRLPVALLGIFTIVLTYFLVQETLQSRLAALFSALFLAISPWHIQYSRASFEASLLLFLLVVGVLSFLKAFKKTPWLVVSAVFFAMTFYTYSTANLFVPVLVLLLLLVKKKDLHSIPSKILISSLVIFVILISPIAYNIFFGHALERYSRFSVFADEEIISEINGKREFTGGLQGKVFYNKPIFIGRKVISNYTQALSPQFLFINGDVTFRHSIHEIGQLYWVQLPFLLFGLAYLLKKKQNSLFWLGWLLLAPLPAALTKDGAIHATRLILLLMPLTVITACGVLFVAKAVFVTKVKKDKHRKVVLAMVGILLLGEFLLYLNRYWNDYPRESWRWWHYGYKEAMQFMKKETQGGKYKIVAFNNTYEPALIRFLFWWQHPPEMFLREYKDDKPAENVLSGFDGFSLGDKYYFGIVNKEKGGIPAFVKTDTIYLVSQRDEIPGDWDWEKSPPAGIKVLKAVRNPYGEPIFYIVTGELPR